MDGLNPEILRWARETAGLTLEAAAERLDLGEARGVAGAARLEALEQGDGVPTRPLLLRMVKHYRRPLLTFYLPHPPKTQVRGEDFRTLPPEHSRTDDALVDSLLRDVRSRQEMVKALIVEDDEFQPLPFIGSMTMKNGAAAVLASIVGTLGLDLAAYRGIGRGQPAGFEYLRARAEHAGIFVLLIGNLGSHHTNIDVDLFRGFALADEVAPFIVINDQDAETAWSFSLMHELCHLWLGSTGVSASPVGSPVEVFCNDVAARFFITPADDAVLNELRGADFDHAVPAIDGLAARFRVSRSMLAYKLLRDGLITREVWTAVTGLFRQQWAAARQDRRDANRDAPGGPSYYVVRRHRVGAALLNLTRRSVSTGDLSPSKAATILGVRPANVHALLGLGSASSGRAA